MSDGLGPSVELDTLRRATHEQHDAFQRDPRRDRERRRGRDAGVDELERTDHVGQPDRPARQSAGRSTQTGSGEHGERGDAWREHRQRHRCGGAGQRDGLGVGSAVADSEEHRGCGERCRADGPDVGDRRDDQDLQPDDRGRAVRGAGVVLADLGVGSTDARCTEQTPQCRRPSDGADDPAAMAKLVGLLAPVDPDLESSPPGGARDDHHRPGGVTDKTPSATPAADPRRPRTPARRRQAVRRPIRGHEHDGDGPDARAHLVWRFASGPPRDGVRFRASGQQRQHDTRHHVEPRPMATSARALSRPDPSGERGRSLRSAIA